MKAKTEKLSPPPQPVRVAAQEAEIKTEADVKTEGLPLKRKVDAFETDDAEPKIKKNTDAIAKDGSGQ